MPVLRFPVERLSEATGLGVEEVRDALFRLKCETDLLETGELEVEVNPDRPDMYSLEGIARAVRGILRIERGWRDPRRRPSGLVLEAGEVSTRPFIVAAVVYDARVRDETDLKLLIQFQEKLHDTIGRRRRKVAIGFHDLEKLPSKRLKYTMMPVTEARFAPLGGERPVSADWVLRNTDQGKNYGGISLDGVMHPFLLAGDSIIAMPPVINAETTRVEPGTKDLFIDVTGTDLPTVVKVLDIIVSNLSERGATVGTVEIIAPYMRGRTPVLEWRELELDTGYAETVLGYGLTPREVSRLLEYMRFNINKFYKNKVTVLVPPFRADIIGVIDLVEDIAIAVGYEALSPVYARPYSRGNLLNATLLARAARRVLTGLGFQEIVQLTLSSPRLLTVLGLEGVEIENPVQLEYSVLRPSLAPGLLAVAAENQHAEKPVKVFEIGRVVIAREGFIDEEERLGLMLMDSEVSIEMLQAPLYSALRTLGVRFSVEPECREPFTIEGRCASLLLEGERLGYVGEVSPGILEALGIEYPVALAEIRLGVILDWKYRTSGQE